MPTSFHGYISDTISLVRGINPKSILDIGVGFGKWGHLFREYLDVMNERFTKEKWHVKIDGVEIFEPYIQPHQKYVYDKIYNGDILDVVDEIGEYDLIFASDVIEHIDKEKGLELIEKLRNKCKNLILIIPIGKIWFQSQGNVCGNKYEAHISIWEQKDFEEMNVKHIRNFKCGQKPIDLFHIDGKFKLKSRVKTIPQQRNVMLQYCNVWWKGGTGLFTIDIAKAYPEFHHIICYRHNSGVDQDMIETASQLGIELFHVPEFTEEFVSGINPFITILHNTGKSGIQDGGN